MSIRAAIDHALYGPVRRIFTGNLYVPGPNGPRRARMEYGIPESDLRFLDRFSGPVCANADIDRDSILKQLRAELPDRSSILHRCWQDGTERDHLALFIMLRVHGSYPVYAVRAFPDTVDTYLVSNAGNCTDHCYRVGLLCDWLGFRVRAIHFWTPSLQGHSVADIYDPVGDTAYLIDSNMNCLFFVRKAGGGFTERIMDIPSADRKRLFAIGGNGRVDVPALARFYDPGFSIARGYASSLTEVNESIAAARQTGWGKALSDELPEMLSRWLDPAKKYGGVTTLKGGGKRPLLATLALGEALETAPLLAKAAEFVRKPR